MTRARSLALVALLVLAAISGPGVGGAAAVEECTQADTMVWLISGGFVNEQCDPVTQSDLIEQMEQNQKDITKVNIAQGAIETKANANTFLTAQNNSLQNWQTPLYSAGQAAGVKSLQNGSTITAAQSAANSTVTARLSVRQANYLSAWNNQMHELENLAQMQANSSAHPLVMSEVWTGSGGYSTSNYRVGPHNFVDYTVTLANGSSRSVTTFVVFKDGVTDVPNSSSIEDRPVWSPFGPAVSYYGLQNGDIVEASTSDVKPTLQVNATAQTNRTLLMAYNGSVTDRWSGQWNRSVDTASRTKANLAPSIQSISNAHAAGANWSELINPMTLAQEYATNYSSTGHWSYALATAASSGYALPDLNETSQMTVSYDGATYEGAVMSQQPPTSGVWEVGKTYNSANITGSQIMLTTSGDHVDLKGEFTITSMTDKTGSALNTTTSQQYVFQAANNSRYYEQMDRLNTLREEIRQREPTTGGGTGGSGDTSGGSSMTAAAIGGGLLLVALGGVFLYGRSS